MEKIPQQEDQLPPETIPNTSKMEYRYLGNSGLRVSVLGYGNWVNNQDEKLTLDTVKTCLENGINFFDTAEAYGQGQGEIALGKAFKELNVPREKIVVTTKIYKIGDDPNDGFLSRKHIIEGMKNSLKRLQLDYVDIVYCHRFDRDCSMEEICRAMNNLINEGYAFYWGTSEWTACQIMDAYDTCTRLKLIKPIVEQCCYNMFNRNKVEDEYRDLFKKYSLGTTIFSPLYSGILTGKYMSEVPKDSRANKSNDNGNFAFENYNKNKKNYDEKLQKLKDLAEKKFQCSLAQFALAWLLVNPDINCCLLGASKNSQIEENCKAIDIYKRLDKSLLFDIERILDNAPRGEVDYRDWREMPNRRNIAMGLDYIKPSY